MSGLNRLYSTTRAVNILNNSGFNHLLADVYSYDTAIYSILKHNEGQYAYFSYIQAIRQSIDHVFYNKLPFENYSLAERVTSLSRSVKTISKNRACIILNNTSLLAHVTVLQSLAAELISCAQDEDIEIFAFNLTASNSSKSFLLWKKMILSCGLKIFQSDSISHADRFLDMINSLKPQQCIWWGWPPGQWIGPLLSPNICHRSVTFKYDYPSSSRFTSHHIGYGDSYVKLISDSTCELYGFNQYFDANLVEGFSFKSCKDSAAKKDLQRTSMPYGKRTLLNIGTLARSEKIAQPHFLKTVASLLEADHRFVFHYTGNIDREEVVQYFGSKNLLSRIKYHGWVKPEKYLPHIDIYLDTFPFGTGQSLVCAGYLGLPLVIMNSPYEANFSNLIKHRSFLNEFKASNSDQYIKYALDIACDAKQCSSLDISESSFQIFSHVSTDGSYDQCSLGLQLFSHIPAINN